MKRIVYYYVDRGGKNPVWEFVTKLNGGERDKCFEYIAYLEQAGEEVRRPVGDYLGGKLYELRPKQVRIIYFFYWKQAVVLVHAFRKKSDGVPPKEIEIAFKRMQDFLERAENDELQLGES